MTEKPITRMDHSDLPLWQQVNAIFARNGLWPPSTGLRDELVTILAWARYGEAVAGTIAEAERDTLAADKARLVATGIALADQAIHCLMGFAAQTKPDLSAAMTRLGETAAAFYTASSAALSGASIPAPADKAEARREALEEAAAIGYRICAETRHVTLGDKVAAAIRALISTPARREGEPT